MSILNNYYRYHCYYHPDSDSDSSTTLTLTIYSNAETSATLYTFFEDIALNGSIDLVSKKKYSYADTVDNLVNHNVAISHNNNNNQQQQSLAYLREVADDSDKALRKMFIDEAKKVISGQYSLIQNNDNYFAGENVFGDSYLTTPPGAHPLENSCRSTRISVWPKE